MTDIEDITCVKPISADGTGCCGATAAFQLDNPYGLTAWCAPHVDADRERWSSLDWLPLSAPRAIELRAHYAEAAAAYEAERPAREAIATARAAARADGPLVHTFESTREAYDASQTSDDICDGDVLLVPSEGVWPIAVTDAHGEFHRLVPPATFAEIDGRDYSRSAEAATAALAKKG